MNVEELMSGRIRTCGPEESLNEVGQAMWERDLGCIPVVDGRDRLVGMITDRDVALAAYSTARPLVDIRVQDVMSRELHCCSPSESIWSALLKMRRHQLHRLPVTDAAGTLVGLISVADVAREAGRERHNSHPSITLSQVGVLIADLSQERARLALVAVAE